MDRGDIANRISSSQRQSLDRLLRSHIRTFRRRQAENLLLQNQVAAPIAASMTTFLSDPFEGDINPGETNGQKLFTLATSKRNKDTKIMISQEAADNVMNLFRQDSNSFGWGILTGCIETTGGDTYSILENPHLLTLE